MKLLRKVGVTSEIWQVFIADSSSTTGAGLTGLVYNSASLTAYYHRDTDTTATAITLATMTVGTFTSSGFKEIDSTNMPGWYQFCPPNAALASGAKSCAFHLKGATNMAPLPIEVDLQGDVNITHYGGTAGTFSSGVPEVNATKFAGQTITCSGGVTIPAATLASTTNITTATGCRLSATGVDDVWDEAQSGHTTAGTFGKYLDAAVSAAGGSGLDAAGVRAAVGLASANLDTQLSTIDDLIDTEVAAIYSRIGAPAGASIAADIAAVKSDSAAILDDTGTSGVVVASGSKTGYSLVSTGLDLVLVDTKTLPAALQIIGAVVGGKISGAGTSTEVFVGLDGSTTRVTVTADSDGNRTAVVYA